MPPRLSLGLEAPPPGSRTARRSLYGQLREAILEGRLAAGLRLPASRELAAELGVSRNTVVAVYEALTSEGYLTSRVGAGAFVAGGVRTPTPIGPPAGTPPASPERTLAWRGPNLTARVLPPTARHDLRLGAPDISRFPFETWGRLCARAQRAFARAPVAHCEPEGRPALRAAIAAHVSFTRAVACRAEDVIVTAGAQQAFDLLARVLMAPGETIAFEDPGYFFARSAFDAAGAAIAPTPVDVEGLVVEQLPPDARVIYVTPSHQFPLAAPMSLARRQALLAHAERTGALLVEDDYDSEFRFDGRPVDALQSMDRSGCVFYVGTFSKCMFPALRLGFIVAPPWARPALVSARRLADWHGHITDQDALAAFIGEGHLGRHIRRMQRLYAARRAALLAALARHAGGLLQPLPAVAGLHLAARVIAPCDLEAAIAEAERRGVVIDRVWRNGLVATAADKVALSYAQVDAAAMDEAIATLADCLQGARA